ncbi:MAG: hypothetical protein IJ654_10510 [Bacteroidales bacterium]|nr:hypothetical protein [Bacteroidales bacterium]
MKKIALAAIAAFVCVSAAAQLNVKNARKATETITAIRTGFVRLCAAEKFIYFTLPSSNQFDGSQMFVLGKDKESALATLDDLIELVQQGEIGSSIEASNGPETCMIRVDKQLGVRVLYFDFPGCAGYCNTSKGEMEKLRAALKKWKE